MREDCAELYVNISLSGYIRVPLKDVPAFCDDDYSGLEDLAEEWWHDSIDTLDFTVDSVDDVIRTDPKNSQRITHRLTEDGWVEVGRKENVSE